MDWMLLSSPLTLQTNAYARVVQFDCNMRGKKSRKNRESVDMLGKKIRDLVCLSNRVLFHMHCVHFQMLTICLSNNQH